MEIISKMSICKLINQWSSSLVGLLIVFGLSACGTASFVSTSTPHYQISGNSPAIVLVVERIQLDFGSGESSITVEQDTKIRPVATIKYKGIGTFLTRWLIDGRVIEQSSIMLNHGSVLTLSPKSTTALPTLNFGRHILRLEIIKPAVTFKHPEISFFVIARSGN